MIESTVKSKNLSKKIIQFFIVFLLGFILFVGYVRYQQGQRVEQLLQQFKQSGYITSLQEMNEKYVLPPSNENGALVIESAFAKLKDPEQKAGEKPPEKKDYIINTGSYELLQPISLGESLSEEVKTAIEKHLAQNEEALKILKQGIGMKQFRYCLDYNKGFQFKIPSLLEMRKLSNLLNSKFFLHLEKSDSEEAVQSILDGFTLADTLSNDPLLITYMIQTAFIQTNIKSLEHLLNRTDVSEKNSLLIASLLQELEDPEGLARCYITDVCMAIDLFSKEEPLYESPKIAYWIGLAETDQICLLELMKKAIDISYMPPQERLKNIDSLTVLADEIQKNSESVFNLSRFATRITLSEIISSNFRLALINILKRIVQLRNAQIALAVERYRLANQKLPEQLSELVPAYIRPELLVDIFDQKPIRYKKLEKGYLIYSVGEDLNDQGGKKADKDQKEGDLVFTVNR